MKSENEQMIQQIMDTDTMGYACVHDSGSSKREEYLVALTAENLANLIGGKSGKARQITVTDVLDRLVADSRMGTLGSCPDQRLCGEINQFRALIQRGEKGAGEILAVSRDAADEYFAAEGNAGILAEYQMLFFIYSISKRLKLPTPIGVLNLATKIKLVAKN